MKPQDCSIGSVESRAAARVMLEVRERNMLRIEIRTDAQLPTFPGENARPFGEWRQMMGGTMLRTVPHSRRPLDTGLCSPP